MRDIGGDLEEACPRQQGRRSVHPCVTRHALERWAERVGTAPAGTSASFVDAFLQRGRRRPRPRHWTRTSAEPGTTFVYLAEHPGVCVVVRGGAAVTVLTRSLCRRSAA